MTAWAVGLGIPRICCLLLSFPSFFASRQLSFFDFVPAFSRKPKGSTLNPLAPQITINMSDAGSAKSRGRNMGT